MKRLIALMLVVIALVLTACQNDALYCAECGQGAPEGANFCSDCGGKLEERNNSYRGIHGGTIRGVEEYLPKDDTDYSILDKGACNENVNWEIRSNGVLYIYGVGTIPNYDYRGAVPWQASPVCSEITDVVISDGISGVGGSAFGGLRLASIYFGHDVIVYEWTGDSLIVNTAYIPASMKADGFVTASYHRELGMTIYYEGDAEEFRGKYLVNSDNPLGPKNYDKYIVYGDFEY